MLFLPFQNPIPCIMSPHAKHNTAAHMSKKQSRSVYRIIYVNQGKIYEIYAHKVKQGELYGFVEIEDLIFGAQSKMVVDPSEEKLKTEFNGVKRFFVPMHAIIRIDHVEKRGAAKIHVIGPQNNSINNVTPFPLGPYPPGGNPGKSN